MKSNKLEKMFELQKKLQSIIEGIDDLPKDMPKIAHDNFSHLVSEASEIFQLDDRWKSWKKNHKFNPKDAYDQQQKLEEIVDAFHCLINIALYSGFSSTDVFEAFILKNEINVKRQKGDY